MSTPATTITFDLIPGSRGSFGARYEDITRPGDTAMRFAFVGYSGTRTTLQARRHFSTFSDASAFWTQVQTLQGRSVVLYDRLNDLYATVFLHAAAPEPIKRIVSSDGRNWSVIFNLDIQKVT